MRDWPSATGLDVVAQPDLLIDPRHFLRCGVADFISCGCLPFAVRDDVVGVTCRLTGGTVGLDQRRARLARWKAALGDVLVVRETSPPLVSKLPRAPVKAAPPTAA